MSIVFNLAYVISSFKWKYIVKKKLTFSLLKHTSRKELKRKEVDDVLGGADAWKNVDSTEGKKKYRA